MQKKSMIKGAGILAISGIIVKIIGAVFRIPLVNIIGSEGIGLYQMAYPIYAFLLVASTAGLPVAISKMVSEEVALGNHFGGYHIFRIARRVLFYLGFFTFLILLSTSGLISKLQGNSKSIYSLVAISPALFFVSLLSAYRGYFQGMHDMVPTAYSQIIEQLGKLVFGLSFAVILFPRGPEFAAAGAILGVSLSEILALIYIVIIYRRRKPGIIRDAKASYRSYEQASSEDIVSKLISIAIPVTLGASIMPMANMSDQIIVVNRLAPIIHKVKNVPYELSTFLSFARDRAYSIPEGLSLTNLGSLMPEAHMEYINMLSTKMYGILTGGVNTLINFPAVLTVALAMSLVPAISEAYALNDREDIIKKTTLGIRLTLLLGLPAAIGLGALAEPIIRVIYRNLEEWEYLFAGKLLQILSLGVIFLTLVQSLTAILQGLGRVKIPVRNLLIGALLKIVLTFGLVSIPSVNIYGAAIGTVVCYATAAILNFIAVLKASGIKFSFKDFIFKPVFSSLLMGFSVWWLFGFIYDFTGSNLLSLALSILAGVIVYIFMLFLTRSIGPEDIEALPKGASIVRILKKAKIFD